MTFLSDLREHAQQLRAETFTLYLAARHPETPWYAKVLAAGVAAYAFSPIDLIPDFIPILGYLDDLIIVPLGIALSIKLVPAAVLAECRAHANDALKDGRPVSRAATVVVVVIWLALAALFGAWLLGALGKA